MSLIHISDNLSLLSSRIYTRNEAVNHIARILVNYNMYVKIFTDERFFSRTTKIRIYTNRRIRFFQEDMGYGFWQEDMPGENVRSQWWVDPRVEFGLQNRRRRR